MEEKKAAARSVRYQDEESAERNGAQAEAAVKDENVAAAAGQRNMPKPAPQPEISLDLQGTFVKSHPGSVTAIPKIRMKPPWTVRLKNPSVSSRMK